MPLTPPPFVILGTPRSRTAWLARLLTIDSWTCFHEPSTEFSSLDDLKIMLARPLTGIADSMLTLLLSDVLEARADVTIVVVRRPVDEVMASLDKMTTIPAAWLRPIVEEIDEIAERISAWPSVLSVAFKDLGQDATCQRIAAHCGVLVEPTRLARLQKVKIEADWGEMMEKVRGNQLGVRRLYGPALDRCFHAATAGERV